MNIRTSFVSFIGLALLMTQTVVGAAGISDAELKAIFPVGTEVIDNTTLDVPDQGYFGAEVTVTIPYKEKLSGADADYGVQFYFRKQVFDFSREQSDAIVKHNFDQFVKGRLHYWGGAMVFQQAGVTSERDSMDGSVSTTTIDTPKKAEVADGVVWFQRSETQWEEVKQVWYTCFYGARVGDFVATLEVTVPDSREKADQWFRSLIAASK